MMDSSQQDPGGVQWVPSQSPIPALQALMREAERDRRTRPSTPIHEPTSWTYPLSASTSAWHSSSSPSLDHSVSSRANILSSAQRHPLASSTSSASQPSRHYARPRSSSHSTISNPSPSVQNYTSRDDEPEAQDFMQLLKRTTKQVNENSKMKERVVWQKEKEKRQHSAPRPVIDNRSSLMNENNSSVRLLAKTSSASAIYPTNSSMLTPVNTPSTSTSTQTRGHALAVAGRSSASSSSITSGKSTSTSLPSPSLNCDPKHRPPYWQSPDVPNHPSACKAPFPNPSANDGNSTMHDVIDLTETDTEWNKHIPGSSSRADTTMCMELDDEDSDTGMDVSFYKPEPPPKIRAPTHKPNPQPPQPTHQPASTQRTRPPPLGMRRAPQPQPSQYNSTQGPRGVTVPWFKPPLLANAGGTMNKNGSGSKPKTSTSRAPVRSTAQKAPVVEIATRKCQDADSSFDVSLDMDVEALEEAMKPYD